MISTHRSTRVDCGNAQENDDAVVVEDRSNLLLNDRPLTEMVASRDLLREPGAAIR
ncbi:MULTISPECIES: hypothetical protein [unclassified Methanoregula]|uniref:hypothetical protein n=1 Tax=unclassified Methanoregula TaxID=2649730 RepID=UPI0009C6D114|nr:MULTISPECIES: hypothetical protein [unclassified Methanoregula]OPX64903.1 MAG: hypothetical protein A4E33_00641 [Methanoregula sp. PtaB.Bin085]OPY32955.1 MAG: hypothetical protein A4E34_02332 [Methanoregula sp. PtaU1.Bin006]